MKLRNIFTVLAAALALATGCQKDGLNLLSEVQVSSSYVAIPQIGGSKTIMVTATDSWSISEMPQWLTISPASGSAGETAVTFSAENTLDGRNCDLNLVCGGKTQIIKVIQGLAVVAPATCSEIIAGPDSKTYRVTGVCTAIANTSYGNWYLNDGTGEIYIYGTVNGSGKYDWASFNIEVGDEVTVEGPKTTYNGTVELVDALFVSVNKSLIKVDSLSIADKKIDIVPIEGAEVVANLTCKGNGISVDIPAAAQSWVSITGIDTGAGKAYLKVAPNAGGDRSTVLTFVTKDSKKSYSSEVTLAQKGAILEVSIAEYLAAAEDDTQYRISGIITSVAQDSEKYGANLYIQDATGKVYIYGTVGEDGKVKTLESFGAKEGDIIEFVGKRSSYNSTPQMAKGQFQWYKTVTPMNAADVAALADDDKNDPKNYIQLTGKVTKNSGYDIEPYGNFDLVDASGSILVYGVSTGWKGETKKFASLGVKEGDTITIVAYKTSYKSNPQVVGMYISHKSASSVTGPYDITVDYTLGASAYDDGAAAVNGTEVAKTIKIGTSSKQGDFSVAIPSGCTKLSFYAVAWKGSTDAVVEIYDGETLAASQSVAGNEGATGNAPYTITVADTDKYSLNVPAGKTVKVTSNKRVIFFGIKAE